jgi:hypothetical protein
MASRLTPPQQLLENPVEIIVAIQVLQTLVAVVHQKSDQFRFLLADCVANLKGSVV